MYNSVSNPNKENYIRHINLYPESGLDTDKISYYHTLITIQSMISALSKIFTNIPDVLITGIDDENTKEGVKAIQIILGSNPDGIITQIFWNSLSSIYEAFVSVDRATNRR